MGNGVQMRFVDWLAGAALSFNLPILSDSSNCQLNRQREIATRVATYMKVPLAATFIASVTGMKGFWRRLSLRLYEFEFSVARRTACG